MFISNDDPTSICGEESNILNDLDEKEAALAAYDQAIRLSPDEATFYQHKGHVLEQLGRLSEAHRAYEEAQRRGYKG